MKKIISILLMVTLTGCAQIKSTFYGIRYDAPRGYELKEEGDGMATYTADGDVLNIYKYNQGVVEDVFSDGRLTKINGIKGFYSKRKVPYTKLTEYHFYFITRDGGYSVSSFDEDTFTEVVNSIEIRRNNAD